jgi:hypothetical protein
VNDTILIGLIVALVIIGGVGAHVATAKGREAGEGFFLGVVLGPFGLLIEVLLPNTSVSTSHAQRPRTPPSPDELGYSKLRADGKRVRACPWCAEEILADAVICRFCGRDIQPADMPPPQMRTVSCSICGVELGPEEARDFNGILMCTPHYLEAIL